MNYAIDKQALVENVLPGHGEVADGGRFRPLSHGPTTEELESSIRTTRERARELLA